MLLGPNYVHLLAVVESLADEWHVHQTKQSDVASLDLSGSTKGKLCLPVERSLSEDRAEKAVVSNVGLDVLQDLHLRLGW